VADGAATLRQNRPAKPITASSSAGSAVAVDETAPAFA
jgi:hypothetical protein